MTPKKNTRASLESKQTGFCGGMSTTELKIRIELILDGVDTRQIIEPVTGLSSLSHALQHEFLSLLTEIAEISMIHAYSLMLVYTSALKLMNTSGHAQWLETIKQALIEGDYKQADYLINNYTEFVSEIDETIVQFADIVEILGKLVSTLSKNPVKIYPINKTMFQLPYTDGKHLFLPSSLSIFDNYTDNYLLYKIIAFQLLGQIQCNTRQAINKINTGISNNGADFLNQFSFIETLRINHYLKREFPGVWKSILYLHQKLGVVPYPEYIFSDYEQTTVFDTLALIEKAEIPILFPQPLSYQCDLSPEALCLIQAEEEKKQAVVMNLFNDNVDVSEDKGTDDEMADRISLRHKADTTAPSNSHEKYKDIWDQLNETVVEYKKHTERLRDEEKQNRVFFYPEWDTSLKQYRQNWCRVEEITISGNDDKDQSLNISELRFSEHQIKKTLDMILNTQRFIRYQDDGDEIDIDAWVEASSNKTKYADDFQHVYIRNNKNNRSVAIMFAVDISGSTAGWKNDIIKQSTWLLSRTLSKLNDQYAIYAFSGSGREQCDIYPVKQFDEKYSADIKQRISKLSAKRYTRMGAAIRHLSKKLNQTEAKTKILFVLTDGRPDDIDSYRGHYGIEDTRRAFNEAKALYLNPFVLTFDKESIDYLPHMLGKKRYRLISNISMLPVQISALYKQLTT